jgi:hypothetical protein
MSDISVPGIIFKAVLSGESSVKLWLLVCAFGIVAMWAHQQWSSSARPLSGKKIVFWLILLLGLYYGSKYLDDFGYYDRWMIQWGMK